MQKKLSFTQQKTLDQEDLKKHTSNTSCAIQPDEANPRIWTIWLCLKNTSFFTTNWEITLNSFASPSQGVILNPQRMVFCYQKPEKNLKPKIMVAMVVYLTPNHLYTSSGSKNSPRGSKNSPNLRRLLKLATLISNSSQQQIGGWNPMGLFFHQVKTKENVTKNKTSFPNTSQTPIHSRKKKHTPHLAPQKNQWKFQVSRYNYFPFQVQGW